MRKDWFYRVLGKKGQVGLVCFFFFFFFFSSSQNHFFSLKKLFLLSRWHPINLNSFSSLSLAQEARPTFWGRIIHYDLEEFWHLIPKENVEFPKMWLHRAYLLNLHLKYSSFFLLVGYLEDLDSSGIRLSVNLS